MIWPVEEIPDSDKLFYRVHVMYVKDNRPTTSVFKERGSGEAKGLSVDWEKYATPLDALNRARDPSKNGIGRFITGDLRKIELVVEHAPVQNDPGIPDNRAHANVKRVEETEARLKLFDLIVWEIAPGASPATPSVTRG